MVTKRKVQAYYIFYPFSSATLPKQHLKKGKENLGRKCATKGEMKSVVF